MTSLYLRPSSLYLRPSRQHDKASLLMLPRHGLTLCRGSMRELMHVLMHVLLDANTCQRLSHTHTCATRC